MSGDRALSDPSVIGRARSTLERIVRNPLFERAILFVIILNAVTLGLETSKTAMASIGGALHALDDLIITIFVVELLMRMIVFGRRFWTDPWCLFDFAVVAITLIPATGNLSIFRALRILRAMRLISAVPSVRRVVASLLSAIPSMGAVIFLLMLINYVFAVMCTKMFGEAFPEMFGTLGASFYTLFQIMTLEGWSGDVVRPVMKQFYWAWAVFVPYIVIVTFAVLNLFIGIIVDAMQHKAEAETDRVIEVTESEYRHLLTELRELRADVREIRHGHAAESSPRRP